VNPSSWSPIAIIILDVKTKYRKQHSKTKHKCKWHRKCRLDLDGKV